MPLCFLMAVTARENVDLDGWTSEGELEGIRVRKKIIIAIYCMKKSIKEMGAGWF